jgi:hypothetical protein
MGNPFDTTCHSAAGLTYEELQAEAQKLRERIATGATSITTDGVTVQYDLDADRTRLRDINRILNPRSRPRAASVNLGGF